MQSLNDARKNEAEAEDLGGDDAWLRTKLVKSGADKRARIPHEQVMDETQALIDRKRRGHADRTKG